MPAPTIKAPRELKPQAEAIRAVYRDAALAAELRVLFALEAERDDEESLFLLF